jgi:hypothetical protein
MVMEIKERNSSELLLVNDQIRTSQNSIAYDSKEYVVEVVVQRFQKGQFFIPKYQRQFVWDDNRRCKFIESVMMGLPIPFLFGVQTADGKVEILDGAQRIQTLHQFVQNDLRLKELVRLDLTNDFCFEELPQEQKNKFLDRSIRMVVLPETVSHQVRLDMFERINTGSEDLKNSEIRKGAYSGDFFDFVHECAGNELFNTLCPISTKNKKRGEGEELVLRYFAYSEKYLEFKHSVGGFLDRFLQEKNQNGFERETLLENFKNMLRYVERNFENGFAKSPAARSTPRVRFESISVGVNLALTVTPNLEDLPEKFADTVEFKKHTTTHASNSGPRLKARVEYIRNYLQRV